MTVTLITRIGGRAMLKLFPHDAKSFSSGQAAVLNDAVNVKISEEINGNRSLTFEYPITDEKANMIKENMIAVCEGQGYRIVRVCREYDGSSKLEAECVHVYNADAPKIHLQNIPDLIGVLPKAVISRAFSNSPFSLFSDSELQSLNMRRVDYDGFKIDFFSVSKTNPYDVMQDVIANCGKGEIWADNYKIALVEKIGSDNGLRLSLDKNLENLRIERNSSDLITRLYPYGYEDAHVGSVNGAKQYIDSENIAVYGIREGYADYGDYAEAEKIYNRALWEFSPDNPDRIDIPEINISGSLIDLSKIAEFGDVENIGLGDTVYVWDNGVCYKERVIKKEYFPYEPLKTEISIGRVKKDLFFYLNQIGALSRQYKRVSSGRGKISAMCISGNVNVQGISVNQDGYREFSGAVNVPYITMPGVTITEENGEVYINGKKILLEEETKDEAKS